MKKVIFLDRDGVINLEPPTNNGYVTRPSEFVFLPRAKKAIGLLNKNGFEVILISNQAGVAKGLYTKAMLSRITEKMLKEISISGGKISKVYYCTHRTEDNCNCRKPKAGLFQKAARGKRIDFKNAYYIGDSERDVIAGKRAGTKTITVLCGRSRRNDIKGWMKQPDYIAKDLYDAVGKIVLRNACLPAGREGENEASH